MNQSSIKFKYMSLLIHTCCGPCLLYPADFFLKNEIDFTVYFYNPNIHPYKEFRARLDSLKQLCEDRKYKLLVERDYGLKEFIRSVVFKEKSRCPICYHTRLKKTAELASKNDFDSFSSTLLYSKYQDHNLIKRQCESFASDYSLSFLYEDFREGWNWGIDESLKENLYRQKYCGCIYSEQERFDNRLKKRLKRERNKNV